MFMLHSGNRYCEPDITNLSVAIPNDVAELGPLAIAVYHAIGRATRQSDSGEFPSQRTIAEMARISVATVKRQLPLLRQAGLIDYPNPILKSAKSSNRKISNRKRVQVMERDQYRCKMCGTWKDLSIDHIHPWSKGGSNDLDNLQTLCRSCNSSKGVRVGGEHGNQ